jgi:hypothetical protein
MSFHTYQAIYLLTFMNTVTTWRILRCKTGLEINSALYMYIYSVFSNLILSSSFNKKCYPGCITWSTKKTSPNPSRSYKRNGIEWPAWYTASIAYCKWRKCGKDLRSDGDRLGFLKRQLWCLKSLFTRRALHLWAPESVIVTELDLVTAWPTLDRYGPSMKNFDKITLVNNDKTTNCQCFKREIYSKESHGDNRVRPFLEQICF